MKAFHLNFISTIEYKIIFENHLKECSKMILINTLIIIIYFAVQYINRKITFDFIISRHL